MKTIGLIGGMSWESTVTYYQLINEAVRKKLGGFHSARILLYSVDFAWLERYQAEGRWDKCAEILTDAAGRLEQAGASFILICSNTLHKVISQVQKEIWVPILHIADAAAQVLVQNQIRTAALLGTRYTMNQDFYKERLRAAGITVLIPEEEDARFVDHVIFDELCAGVISEESRNGYAAIIKRMKERGAEGVIFGCTEIGLLVRPQDSVLPVFDTTKIHADVAVEKAFE